MGGYAVRFVLVLILAFLFSDAYSQTDLLKLQLRERYQGKTFLVRGFLTGEHLYYASSGAPVVNETSGDWTADGFVKVNKVQIRQQSLILQARRLVAVYIDHRFKLLPAEQLLPGTRETSPVFVEITVDLGRDAASMETIEALTSKVFLGAQDSLVDLVPDYWKSCVRSGLMEKFESCHFSPDILAIQGVKPPAELRSAPSLMNQRSLAPTQLFRVGNGVSPPMQIHAPDPTFSEAARGLNLQGTEVLGLTVSAEGTTTSFHILSRLGAGLDANAVHAVEGWKFKPAEKDGHPVAVIIAVEIEFHLQ